MSQTDAFDITDQEQLKEIIRYLDEPGSPIPAAIKEVPLKDLGSVFELETEYLIIMPPNLALRMPKKDGATLDSVRDQVISMVAMHVKLRGQE